MNDRSKMEDLYSKYKGFQTPAAKILLGDGKLDLMNRLNARVDELTVTLPMENSGSASFSIVNAYDGKNRKLDSTIMDQLVLGNIVRVQLGYESNLESLFTGFIYSVKIEYEDSVRLSINAMDLRRLMEDTTREKQAWKAGCVSDVVKQVLKDYSKLYSRIVVDKTPDIETLTVTQNETDLAFINRLAMEEHRSFFVFDDVIYFRRKGQKAPALTMSWGRDLITFSKESIYVDQKITVVGLKEEGKEPLTATVEVKTEDNMNCLVPGGNGVLISSPKSDTQDKVTKKAEKKAEVMRTKKQTGSGTCVGIPELVPGRFITLSGLESKLNGNYQVKSVTHSFGGDGFRTSFEIGGYGG